MKYLMTGTYSDFKTVVENLGVPALVVYSRDNQTDVQSVQAILMDGSVVYGNTTDAPLSGSSVLTDFPQAVELEKTPVVKSIVS